MAPLSAKQQLDRARRVFGRILSGSTDDLKKLSTPYRGNVDGYGGGVLQGWVVRRKSQHDPLRVGLFVDGGMIATRVANQNRPDVQAAGYGDGKSGFAFPIDDTTLETIIANGGEASVHVLDDSNFEIGKHFFDARPIGSFNAKSPQIKTLNSLLYGDLELLLKLDNELSADAALAPLPKLTKHQAMFDHISFGKDDMPLQDKATKLPAYIEFMKRRMKLDRRFDTDGSPGDFDHCLNWYLIDYARLRHGRRIPLSKDVIEYLNAPVTMGGLPYTLSRVMWWRLMHNRPLLNSIDLANANWFNDALYWWAFHEARERYFEDCLVPRRFRDMLRAVHPNRRDDLYPMSTFLELFYRKNPGYKFLNPANTSDRETLTLALMVMAVTRPDLLRYIPGRSLLSAFESHDGLEPPFAQFVAALAGENAPEHPMTYARYHSLLRNVGYDLTSQSFLSVTPSGDRFEAAALPAVSEDTDTVDVQMIGPFEKASGLGQATRLSQTALEQSGLSINAVDFGLDNPAPEGFSKVGALSDHKRAKINLIHLNAESIPLAFAYEPDVFSDAYNIGYFFWELNSPASCHYLGMEMLDEIWVSTEYGVSIYKPETGKPVTNVGMCFEEVPNLTREDARDFVTKRFRLTGNEFVFLVAFDSFSFVQRKNPIGVLRAFQKAFESMSDVRLIVKTQNRDNVLDPVQGRIWKQVEAIVEGDHRIQVLNETLTYENLLRLKKGADCYISLHKSEGWGFGMIEAMNLKVPVVCTGYSGNLEFCNDETAWMVDFEETPLLEDDYIFVRRGQVWAEPDQNDAAAKMRAVYDQPEARIEKAEAAWNYVQQYFAPKAISARYEERLREILAELPAQESDMEPQQ